MRALRRFLAVSAAIGLSVGLILATQGEADTCDTAIGITAPHSEIMTITQPDHDWRSFTVADTPKRVLIETRLTANTIDDDTDLNLYGGCEGGAPEDFVAFNDDSGEGFLSSMEPCLSPGTYYLEVGGWADIADPNDFELVVEELGEFCLDAPDPSEIQSIFTPETTQAIPDGPVDILFQQSVYAAGPFVPFIPEVTGGFLPQFAGIDAVHGGLVILHGGGQDDEPPGTTNQPPSSQPQDSFGGSGVGALEVASGPTDCLASDCLPRIPALHFSVAPTAATTIFNDGQIITLFEGEVYTIDVFGVISLDEDWDAIGFPNTTLDALALFDGSYYISTETTEFVVFDDGLNRLHPGNIYRVNGDDGGTLELFFDGAALGIPNIDAAHVFPGGVVVFSTAQNAFVPGPGGVMTLFQENTYACHVDACLPIPYFLGTDVGIDDLNGYSVGGVFPYIGFPDE